MENLNTMGLLGEYKSKYSFLRLAIFAIFAGIWISIGCMGYVRASLFPDIGHFIGSCIFPVGLIGILLGGGELVSGNVISMNIAFLQKRITLFDIFRNWIIVFLFNFVGTYIAAFIFEKALNLPETQVLMQQLVGLASERVARPMSHSFIVAVGCGILVSLAIWINYKTDNVIDKIIAIWFPIMVFVLISFKHVVADMFYIIMAILSGLTNITWDQFTIYTLVVLLGNIVGGIIFASLYYIAYTQKEIK